MTFQKGELNPSWKGGRYVDHKGYVRTLLRGHPRADKSDHVLEHILIMEQFLGRPLAEDEETHHKNGIKTDNRIENLQLVNHAQHMGYHTGRRINTEDRRCIECGTAKTYVDKHGVHVWLYVDEHSWRCKRCYMKRYSRGLK